jgi:hypothetical protein
LRLFLQPALALATLLGALAAGSTAWAGEMDPTPERLYVQPPGLPLTGAGGASIGCQQVAANPNLVFSPPFPAGTTASPASPTPYACRPNNVAWANMMSELGMAIAPPAFHAARTTGLGGFALTFQASFTKINADAYAGGVQYWHDGTQGNPDPNTGQFPIRNGAPDGVLQVYTVNARKGMGYGFEIDGALGYVANTSLWIGGGDLHWAPLEGYRTGVLGYVPDFAIGAGVRTLGGSPKFYLTTVGIDAQVSKPFDLADSAVVTPYLGLQRIIIFADSNIVDFTPNVDPLQQCGYLGQNVPGNPYAHAPYTGLPVCQNKLANGADANADFNNDAIFNKARIHRWRWVVGANYRYDVLYLAGQFAADLTDPGSENSDLGITGDKQWTLSLEAGVSF